MRTAPIASNRLGAARILAIRSGRRACPYLLPAIVKLLVGQPRFDKLLVATDDADSAYLNAFVRNGKLRSMR